ncbi:hypothetical protein ABFX02_08G217300 [Erythranthe guttata]
MSAWMSSANRESNPVGFERFDKDTTGYVLFPKSALGLMQNCDLPPPVKLFSGPNETLLSKEKGELEILKALRLSQTRAREAERKLRTLIKEKDELSRMLVDDSLRLFAYRQWVRLLELELNLQRRQQQKKEDDVMNYADESKEEENYEKDGIISTKNQWCTAIGLCLAFAGFGFALGYYSYLF